MGRLQKKKGFDILIDSFAKVIKKHSDILLFIAGPDEGERENLEQQIEKLELIDKVFLVPPLCSHRLLISSLNFGSFSIRATISSGPSSILACRMESGR